MPSIYYNMLLLTKLVYLKTHYDMILVLSTITLALFMSRQ